MSTKKIGNIAAGLILAALAVFLLFGGWGVISSHFSKTDYVAVPVQETPETTPTEKASKPAKKPAVKTVIQNYRFAGKWYQVGITNGSMDRNGIGSNKPDPNYDVRAMRGGKVEVISFTNFSKQNQAARLAEAPRRKSAPKRSNRRKRRRSQSKAAHVHSVSYQPKKPVAKKAPQILPQPAITSEKVVINTTSPVTVIAPKVTIVSAEEIKTQRATKASQVKIAREETHIARQCITAPATTQREQTRIASRPQASQPAAPQPNNVSQVTIPEPAPESRRTVILEPPVDPPKAESKVVVLDPPSDDASQVTIPDPPDDL